jgi:hypothetical protein
MDLHVFARSLLVVLGLAFVPAPAGADEAPAAAVRPIPPAEEASLEGFAAGAPLCLEWSDGCAVCARDGKAAHCSTPGIACQPGPIVCRSEKK